MTPSRLTMTMPSGAASSRPRNSLVWRYLSLGSRMPMATNGPWSVRVGLRVRSTVVEVPLVAQLGVADGDLDVVVHHGRDRDLLEGVHGLTPEVLDGVPGHGLGRYAD